MEESRKVYGWLVRDGNAAAGCSSMWAGTRGGENYCGNSLWQSGLTLLPPTGNVDGIWYLGDGASRVWYDSDASIGFLENPFRKESPCHN